MRGLVVVAALMSSLLGLMPACRAETLPSPPDLYSVGVAQVEITPTYPIRLSGFGFRRGPSEGVTQAIWAKAFAISQTGESEPVVLITVDNLGIPAAMCDEVAQRLDTKVGLKRSRLAITASHTHTAPMLRGVAATLFAGPISDEDWQQIDRYTRELTDQLESVALAALKDRQPSRISWGVGTVKFAINRRTKGGPVDHDLPVLVVKRGDGKIRGVYVNYACHCVTLSNNKISGDWAGYAQDILQREFPQAVAMVSVGCGADQNPSSGVTGDKSDVALQQGAEIAAEVKRLVSGFLAPVTGEILSALKPITLDFAEGPTRAQWEERAKRNDASGYHARVQLERLDRGESLQATLNYPVTSWTFGESLAMVFLPGEVVVDYSQRLKQELDGSRLWINAYANDAPCYIPSERILKEGGYEAHDAMYYYDRPGALKTGLENQIVLAVREQLDPRFASPFDSKKTSGTRPKSPQQSLALLQTNPDLRVDLVVAEPLIADPVAIDFGLDGGLWVAEMHDYPDGIPSDQNPDEASAGGGRIRLIRDADGDGQFDRSTIFLDHIPLPTGVTVWRKGVLICSAPDILYAEDTDGDDKADLVKKLYSGFGTANNQARLNSLVPGLDGWVYGSCGLFGGTITNLLGEKYELGDRDFRIKPDTGEIEAATGRTQQGRVRDDFGRWFGCDNTNLAYHYPLAEHNLKRNPYVTAPASRVNLVQTDDAGRLFPAKTDAQRFQLSGPPGTVTAACGIGVYRDSLLGPDYQHQLFVCEPVNLLVHRMGLGAQGSSFRAERPANETTTEFLRSTDGWFRPVQAVTGPDGGLWVVDMYRFIIEDPRWIPEQELAPLDVRAGSTFGRIYRVTKADGHIPPATRFAVTARGETPKNPQLLQRAVYQELEIQELESRPASTRASTPKRLLDEWRRESEQGDPVIRLRSLRKLAAVGQLDSEQIRNVLLDGDSRLRLFGVTLAERSVARDLLLDSILQAAEDQDPQVRLQVACSLGTFSGEKIGATLAKMALKDAVDPYLVAAVFSSVSRDHLRTFTQTLFHELAGGQPPPALMAPFLATAVGYADDEAIKLALRGVAGTTDQRPETWQLNAIADLIESLGQRSEQKEIDTGVQQLIERMRDEARTIATTEELDEAVRLAAIRLLGREPSQRTVDLVRLGQLLSPAHPPNVQMAAVEAFERIASDDVPGILAARFLEVSPSVQPRIVDTLLSRDLWYPLLFDEIAKGSIPATAITAAQRQELVGHPTPAVRERALNLLASTFNADRQQVVHQYRSALDLVGDADRGKALFGKSCSQCHQLGGVGHAVGPNLAMVANKTPSFILQELFDPNRNVDTRYVSYVAVTKGGLIRTGLLSSESSNSISLLATEGKQFSLLRAELEELRATGKSLMPEGLEKDLTPQGVADLIRFLSTLPATPKQLVGNTPDVVRPVNGRVTLQASVASLFGDQITFEPQFGNVGFWHGNQDHVVWTMEIPAAAEFDLYLDGACDAGSAGNRYLLEIGKVSWAGAIESTGGWDQYVQSRLGTIELAAGTHRVVMRPEGGILRGALVDLRGLHLIPVGTAMQPVAAKRPLSAVAIQATVARILDDQIKENQREALIADYPDHAAALVKAMTEGMPVGTPEEYRRIPWIWRVAVASGKRDQAEQLEQLLEVSLPQLDEPLRDWQAVVIGGGVINGIGLKGGWPKTRIDEILDNRPALQERWKKGLLQAAKMADNEPTFVGTRYDALRMIALDDWMLRREQLVKYLAKGIHDELQMGAISGLSDVDSMEIPRLLVSGLGHFNDENRGLAIGALMRTSGRSMVLLDAIAEGRVSAKFLNTAERKLLRESTNARIREQAIRILSE